MFTSLDLPSVLVKQIFPKVTITEQLAMLGDTVTIKYGNGILTGIVVEGDPMLDSWNVTWFCVEGVVITRDGSPLVVRSWVNDGAVLEIIERA